MSELNELDVDFSIQDNHEMSLMNESDLQIAIVKFIRQNDLLFTSFGDSEFLNTSAGRIQSVKRGYQNGSPDLIIFEPCQKYVGLVIEVKSPSGLGKLTNEQILFLNNLKKKGFYILVSNNFAKIIKTIVEYQNGLLS